MASILSYSVRRAGGGSCAAAVTLSSSFCSSLGVDVEDNRTSSDVSLARSDDDGRGTVNDDKEMR
jgi:hypothetical protein